MSHPKEVHKHWKREAIEIKQIILIYFSALPLPQFRPEPEIVFSCKNNNKRHLQIEIVSPNDHWATLLQYRHLVN
jgi:hypothetical protein